ncbi:MAG: hypothetical protein ABIQ89_00055 [Candidatus Saccharimonadales bacterium]
MPIDYLGNESNSEPYILFETDLRRHRFIEHMYPGEHGFIDLDALWAHPNGLGLMIDCTYEIMTAEEATVGGFEPDDVARIVTIEVDAETLYAVDITHIQEARRAEGLPLEGIPTQSAAGIEQLEEVSCAGHLLIQDYMTLEYFGTRLVEAHTEDAALPPLTADSFGE